MREVLRNVVVVAGPNPRNSQSKVLKIDGSCEYYNDTLSEDEEYILCGGHHSKVERKTTVLYWWPKPSVWSTSGFNLGCWSKVAEEWFRHHRAEIRNSMAQPHTNKHWKNALAHYRHTRKFMDSIESVSAGFVLGKRFQD